MRCPSCRNKKKIEILEETDTFKVLQCLKCDLHFSDTKILPKREWYEKTLVDSNAMVNPQVWTKWSNIIYSRFLKKRGDGKTLLDIGCGDGNFISRAQKKGYKVTGIDFNNILISKVKKAGLKAYPLSLKQFVKKYPKRTFDTVTLFEVLEHTTNPGHTLSLVENLLKPKGSVVISVPNRNRFRFSSYRYPKWDRPPHHFTWWSSNALKNLLTLRNFEILDFKEFEKIIRNRPQQGKSKEKKRVKGPYLFVYAKRLE